MQCAWQYKHLQTTIIDPDSACHRCIRQYTIYKTTTVQLLVKVQALYDPTSHNPSLLNRAKLLPTFWVFNVDQQTYYYSSHNNYQQKYSNNAIGFILYIDIIHNLHVSFYRYDIFTNIIVGPDNQHRRHTEWTI